MKNYPYSPLLLVYYSSCAGIAQGRGGVHCCNINVTRGMWRNIDAKFSVRLCRNFHSKWTGWTEQNSDDIEMNGWVRADPFWSKELVYLKTICFCISMHHFNFSGLLTHDNSSKGGRNVYYVNFDWKISLE